MSVSTVKVVVLGVLALALIIGLIVGLDPVIAVPLLTLILGYFVGNADVTGNKPVLTLRK